MCGIFGIHTSSSVNFNIQESDFENLLKSIAHRGPDGHGIWRENNLWLGHRRLSIIDLSDNAKQPMKSHSERYVLTFNGEIYNFEEIKSHIEKYYPLDRPWRSTGDTEVLLESFARQGIETTLKMMRGMFAGALWDREEKKLTLFRDVCGEKPLYYGFNKGIFFFSSELKTLQKSKFFNLELNQESVRQFLEFSFIAAPQTIYQNIFKLQAAHLITLTQEQLEGQKLPNSFSYWSYEDSFSKAQLIKNKNPDPMLDLQQKLEHSVKSMMIADVPLGAFLSGGIDSSLIVSLMQKISSQPVRTFTVGFDNKDFDEAPRAKQIAKILNTDHHELYFSKNDALDLIPKINTFWDEPFADSSQIPTYFICKYARTLVKVALSGDGGDELFGGYNRYFNFQKFQKLNKLNQVSSGLLASVLSKLGHQFSPQSKFSKLSRISTALNKSFTPSQSLEAYYLSMLALADFRPKNSAPQYHLSHHPLMSNSPEQQMMTWDFNNYLSNDVLTKVDRASMSVSLETRAPFLSQEMIEASFRLSISEKIERNQGKVILQKVLDQFIPRKIFEGPKRGFAVPLGDFLRNELKDWSKSLIYNTDLSLRLSLDPVTVIEIWKLFENKRINHFTIWNYLSLLAWKESQIC